MLVRASFKRLCQLASIASVFALVYLSLAPAQLMTRTQVLSGTEEHWIAYMLTALIATATTKLRSAFAAAGGLVLLAGMLELGQNLSIGRHPELTDFSASALGAVMGTVIGSLILFAVANRSPLVATATTQKHST